ncbi:Peroxidase, family 2-domain-containing protein [Chaetomium sp. MPI-CAGE-AT-0009]|nr:Peroxidase, family 2-domain-containing protein [Chaetomium sp. MPI-CAGE-AT-0009]
MRTSLLPALAAVTPVLAGFDTWSPPGPYDVRGPCPMLNTLTNHGFFPHNGRNIDQETTENALFDALNLNKTLGKFLFDFALTTNPIANATTFSLNDLGNHNVLEHDASLSRADAYHGSVLTFNHTIFEETKSYWTDELITLKMAADARYYRIKTSQATNPEYTMSELGDAFTYGESAAYVVLFGDKESKTVPRSWVEWLFEKEQLPQHLGWKRPAVEFVQGDLERFMDEIQNITKEIEAPGCESRKQRRKARVPSHFGF